MGDETTYVFQPPPTLAGTTKRTLDAIPSDPLHPSTVEQIYASIVQASKHVRGPKLPEDSVRTCLKNLVEEGAVRCTLDKYYVRTLPKPPTPPDPQHALPLSSPERPVVTTRPVAPAPRHYIDTSPAEDEDEELEPEVPDEASEQENRILTLVQALSSDAAAMSSDAAALSSSVAYIGTLVQNMIRTRAQERSAAAMSKEEADTLRELQSVFQKRMNGKAKHQ